MFLSAPTKGTLSNLAGRAVCKWASSQAGPSFRVSRQTVYFCYIPLGSTFFLKRSSLMCQRAVVSPAFDLPVLRMPTYGVRHPCSACTSSPPIIYSSPPRYWNQTVHSFTSWSTGHMTLNECLISLCSMPQLRKGVNVFPLRIYEDQRVGGGMVSVSVFPS